MTVPPSEILPQRPVDMLLRFSCPMCATFLEIPRARTGQEGPCPVCSATIVAPSVVIEPPLQRETIPAQPAVIEPRPDQVKVDQEDLKIDDTPDPHTTRLCDLPPRPAFQARREPSGGLPAAQLPEPKHHRERRRRNVVGVGKTLTPWQYLKKEFWMIVLVLLVVGIALAFAVYGDKLFSGVNDLPFRR